MSDKKLFILVDAARRQRCSEFVLHVAPEGYCVRIEAPAKKREQEEKYHAMIGDIARQTTYAGKRWHALHTKRILIDEFAEVMRQAGTPLHHDSILIPSEDGRRVIQLEIHSAEFWVKEASEFIEFLFSWGADRSVAWSDPALKRERRTA